MGEDKREALVAVASSYAEWLSLVEDMEPPGFSCPLCIYAKKIQRETASVFTRCDVCPVKWHTGMDCTDDTDLDGFTREASCPKPSPLITRRYGRAVLDKLISVWLDILDGDFCGEYGGST